MRFRSSANLLAGLTLSFAAAACSAAPPKQAEAPDADKETGVDMAATEAAPAPAAEQATAEASGEEEMHAKCCAECKTGLAKDRTGAAATTIPCADFTDTLSPWCLEHFRSKPVMASQCK